MVLWCAAIFALSSIPDHRTTGAALTETFSRKAAHLVEYGVLAFLTLRALMASGVLRQKALRGALVFCLFYAVSDEVHQSFVPGRYGKARDVALDGLGAALTLSVYSRRRWSPAFPPEVPSR